MSGITIVSGNPALEGVFVDLFGRTLPVRRVWSAQWRDPVEVAMDAIMEDLAARRSDTVLAFLLTPTDVFLVPEDALEASRRHFAKAGISRLWQAPMRGLTGGRFYAQNLRREIIDPSGRRYGLYDGIVPSGPFVCGGV